MPTVQYVYVLSNSLYPSDVFKIGSTKENPSTRAYQLQSTGVPVPFTIEYIIVTWNGDKLEKEIHRYLHDYRVNPKREFFKIDKSNLYQILTDEMGLKMIPFSEFHHINESEHVLELTHGETKYCPVCNISCRDKYSFQKHCKSAKHLTNSNEQIDVFDCEYCGKKYQYRQSMKFHQKTCKEYLKFVSTPKNDTNDLSTLDKRQLIGRINQLEKDTKIQKLESENESLKQKLMIAELEKKIIHNSNSNQVIPT